MPLVVIQRVVTELNRLRVLLRTLEIQNTYFKFTTNSTLIFTDSETNYNKLLQYMKTQATIDEEALRSQFHTYTPITQKTHSNVICGFDHQQTTEEVQDALLNEYDIKTKGVYEMKATTSATTLNLLTQTVKYLMAVGVTIKNE